jgi:hypothetical protein
MARSYSATFLRCECGRLSKTASSASDVPQHDSDEMDEWYS